MKESRIRSLFDAARARPPIPAPDSFAARVAGAARRETRSATTESAFDSLALLFPRLAWAAVLVIGLCAAVEWRCSAAPAGDLSMNVAAIAHQWLFVAD